MNISNWHWAGTTVQSRFGERGSLSRDDNFHLYFESLGLPREEVVECLELIEVEYNLPVGFLRPADELAKLFEPVPMKNLWHWLGSGIHESDSQTELEYQLGKRMRRYGTFDLWTKIETIEDFVRAWCGEKPASTSVQQE